MPQRTLFGDRTLLSNGGRVVESSDWRCDPGKANFAESGDDERCRISFLRDPLSMPMLSEGFRSPKVAKDALLAFAVTIQTAH